MLSESTWIIEQNYSNSNSQPSPRGGFDRRKWSKENFKETEIFFPKNPSEGAVRKVCSSLYSGTFIQSHDSKFSDALRESRQMYFKLSVKSSMSSENISSSSFVYIVLSLLACSFKQNLQSKCISRWETTDLFKLALRGVFGGRKLLNILFLAKILLNCCVNYLSKMVELQSLRKKWRILSN